MSPGADIAIASCAVMTAVVRSTGRDWRESISSLRECSISLSGQNPCVHPRNSAIRSGGTDRRNSRPSSISRESNTAPMLSSSM